MNKWLTLILAVAVLLASILNVLQQLTLNKYEQRIRCLEYGLVNIHGSSLCFDRFDNQKIGEI